MKAAARALKAPAGGHSKVSARSLSLGVNKNPNRTPSEHANPTTKTGSKMGLKLFPEERFRHRLWARLKVSFSFRRGDV